MPCDNVSMQTVNPDFVAVISDIESLLEDHIRNSILCGDWNTDLPRNTAQINYITYFIEHNNLSICWDIENAVQGDVYAHYSLNNFSYIDYYLSLNLFRDMHRCDVNTSLLNPSDQRDIHIAFNRRIDYQYATIGQVV